MAAREEDVAAAFGGEPNESSKRHPAALFFHVIFRVSAIVAYEFCSWFTSSVITPFIIVVLLSAFDFWTVKNVTGRLLVGLRWWNKVDEDGKSQWVFEARKDGRKPLVSESRIFWWSLFIGPIVWVLLGLVSILKFNAHWLLVALVGAAFTGSNLYGYVRCAQGNTSLRATASQYIGRRVLEETFASQAKPASTTSA